MRVYNMHDIVSIPGYIFSYKDAEMASEDPGMVVLLRARFAEQSYCLARQLIEGAARYTRVTLP
jgi:hypothetical protein